MNSSSAQSPTLYQLNYLQTAQVKTLIAKFGSPLYVYSEEVLRDRARAALKFSTPFGTTVRFAMKANPQSAILRIFDSLGLAIDASSDFEAYQAMEAGIKPDKIMLTSQQLPIDLPAFHSTGAIFNATSLHQLEYFGQLVPGGSLSVRVNCGESLGRSEISVAGPNAGFGIWHEQADEILSIATKYDLNIHTIHSHIGCGNSNEAWLDTAVTSFNLLKHFPTVSALNLGGGFKVARMPNEHATDIGELASQISAMLEKFAVETGRKIHIEIEPGTFLTANAGTLLATAIDITSTGKDGFTFLKLDTGMNDFLRPALYGSQHPIVSLSDSTESADYAVIGHTCESTDLLSPIAGQPGIPTTRTLKKPHIGDIVAIEGCGAYCASMRAVNYNSFPPAKEVLLSSNGDATLLSHMHEPAKLAV